MRSPTRQKRRARSSTSASLSPTIGTLRPPTRYIRSFIRSTRRVPRRRRRCTSMGSFSGTPTRRPKRASPSTGCMRDYPNSDEATSARDFLRERDRIVGEPRAEWQSRSPRRERCRSSITSRNCGGASSIRSASVLVAVGIGFWVTLQFDLVGLLAQADPPHISRARARLHASERQVHASR